MLMLMFYSVAAITCPSFICANSSQLYKAQCIYSSTTTYYLAPCTNKLIPYCQPSVFNTSCTITPSANLLSTAWPGESCSQDSTCAYGMCYKSRCNAQNFAADCSLDDECNPGLFCNATTHVCEFLIQPFTEGCTKDTDCVNSAGCNFGTCLPYYSLRPGDKVELCPKNQSPLCQFQTCGLKQNSFICGSGVKSYSGVCNTNSDCVSTIDSTLGYSITSQCKCSYGQVAFGYCSKLPGDSEFAQYINSLAEWLQSEEIKMCSAVRRFTDECLMVDPDNDDTLQQKLFIQIYPQIVNNTDCTKAIFNRKYWQLVEDSSLEGFGTL